ncbi:hypothetical protein V8D89_008271 [Ganoderma adspersum]
MRESNSTELTNHLDPHSIPQPPPGPSSLDLLRMAAFRGDLADIPRLISDVVTGHNPQIQEDTLSTLLRCLAELGIDLKSIHEAAARTRTLYCPRCNRIYRDVDNGPHACIIRHEFPFVAISQDGTPQSKHYSCCGLITPASPDSEDRDGGVCYVRPHAWIDDSPPLVAQNAFPSSTSTSTSSFPPQPAMPTTNIAPINALATTSDSEFPSCIARTDTSHASLRTTSPTVNPAAPAPSEFAPAATLANPRHINPVPDPVDHTPMIADAHSPAAQWWTEPLPPCASPSQNSDSRWSPGMHGHTNADADAMRVPPPEVLVTTIPWEESSLYHPPGWIRVPAALRDDPPRSTGRSRGPSRDRGNGPASTVTRLGGMGRGAPRFT